MTNAEVSRSLRELALYLEMDGVPFKPQAYERAAYAIASLDRPVSTLYEEGGATAMLGIPGVGKGIANRIVELVREGKCKDLERYRSDVPVDIASLTELEGLGPKRVMTLWKKLGIRSIGDLERAIEQGRLRHLPGFGSGTESNLRESIRAWRQHAGRWPIGEVLRLARVLEQRLRGAASVESASVAGSLRRLSTTVGDLDYLVVTSKPRSVMELFAGMPEVERVYAKGSTKTMVRLEQGIDADLRVVPKESFGAALQYFTGSKAHNVALRRIAISKGLKLSEYGLFRGDKSVGGRTEEELYRALGLEFIPPELREDEGEIEAASEKRLPRLIEPALLRGDLQVHTKWTDGRGSIEDMALAARELGLEYIAITDHTRDLAMTGGLDEERLLKQMDLIRETDKNIKGIRLLSGAEVNIRRDGTLDIEDEVLARLDVVGAAVHSHFSLSREESTRRLVRAMENPHVDIIFHPSARRLGGRQPIDIDLDAVFDAALRTGTVMEIDAQPERLDLDPRHVREAVRRGVMMVISSDAHDARELRFTEEYGIGVARRGWAEAGHILNTLPLHKLLERLKDGRGARPSPDRRRKKRRRRQDRERREA